MFLDGGCDSSLMFPIFQVFLPAPEGGSYLVCSLGLERAFILLCFARRGWYVDLLRVDGWSIHHSLDLYLRGCYNPYVLFLIFILPVWVDLHFMDKLVRFMSHSFLLCIFPFFLIIYLWAFDRRLKLGTNLVESHSFLRHLHWPYKKNESRREWLFSYLENKIKLKRGERRERFVASKEKRGVNFVGLVHL
jgi:hypothetical protein